MSKELHNIHTRILEQRINKDSKEEKIVGQCKSSVSKELEALEKGIIEFEKDLEDDCNNEWLKRVVAGMKKCYQRLEAIDNANPSEAMKCFFRLGHNHREEYINGRHKEDYSIIEQYILKAQEQEKVLKIMFTKIVSIFQLSCCKNVNEYNDLKFNDNEKLTKEEFELLRRYLV